MKGERTFLSSHQYVETTAKQESEPFLLMTIGGKEQEEDPDREQKLLLTQAQNLSRHKGREILIKRPDDEKPLKYTVTEFVIGGDTPARIFFVGRLDKDHKAVQFACPRGTKIYEYVK